jgi:tetratricopeptide (TPR) repeat protein
VDLTKQGRRTILICVALSAVTLAAFWPVIGSGFISFDDLDYVTNNPHVTGGIRWSSVAWAFKTGHMANWHPVTWLSHMVDCQLYGLRAAGHHVTNLLFHVANTLLLFLLLQQVTRDGWRVTRREGELVTPPPPPLRDTRHPTRDTLCWPCFFVAALFALHPLHVESVAWVAERKDVLSTFFFLLTLLAYVKYVAGGRRPVGKGGSNKEEPRNNIQHPTSNIQHPISDAQHPASGIRHPASSIQHPASSIQHPASSIQHPASSIQHPVSNNTLDVSRFTFHVSRFYLLSLLFFALGLMSKPMLVTVPFVLLLLDYWPLRRMQNPSPRAFSLQPLAFSLLDKPGNAQLSTLNPQPSPRPFSLQPLAFSLLDKLPFFALSAASCVVTFLVQQGAGATTSLGVLPLEFRISNALISYVRYALKMVWPANLAVLYALPTQWPAAWVAGAALVLAGVSVLALRLARKAPWFAFGWFWYLGTLVPVIGIVQVGQQAMADRYSYIPLIGLFVAIAWGGAAAGARWPRIRGWLAAVAVAALVVCGGLTWRQTGYWRSSTSLFEHALAVTRDNYVAHNNLGVLLLDGGDLAGAESHFAEAVRIKPNYPDGLGNLATCRQRQGRLAEAEDLFARSLKSRPTAAVHYDLAILLAQEGKIEEAYAHYEAALRLKPEFAEAWYNLGALESKRGRPAEAARDYAAALHLKAGDVEAHLSLGALLAGEKKFEEAEAHFQAALQTAPDNPDAHFNLAAALNAKGDYAGAAVQFAEVCRLRPEDVEARKSLGLALLYQGKMPEAAGQFCEVLRAQPDARMHYYLGLALDSQGQAEEAVVHYREAVRLSPNTALYLNDLAWLRATNPKAELRDGAEAVRLAELACELSGGKEARFWGTLDAAYAEAGRFADAQATAAKTRELALASREPELAGQAEQRMALYRAGKPYRAPAPVKPAP